MQVSHEKPWIIHEYGARECQVKLSCIAYAFNYGTTQM